MVSRGEGPREMSRVPKTGQRATPGAIEKKTTRECIEKEVAIMTNLVPRSFGLAAEAPIDLYNMLDDFFSGRPSSDPFKVDVSESDTGYLVEADLPGISKDNLDIEMEDDKLTIAVNYDESKDDSDASKNYVHRERRHYSMTRTAYLKDADAEKISAKLENGVLTLDIPKIAPKTNVHKVTLD